MPPQFNLLWTRIMLVSTLLLVACTADTISLDSRRVAAYRHEATAPLCPPGKLWDNGTQQHCICVEELVERRIISCDEGSRSSKLLLGFCMTFDYTTNTTMVGPCPYVHTQNVSDGFYTLPESALELSISICDPVHREGLLCGRCKKNTGLSISSDIFQCTSRENAALSIVLYIFLQCGVVLVLFLVVTSFKIGATHPPLLAFAFYAHVVTMAIDSNDSLYFRFNTLQSRLARVFAKATLALYGIWSLTFFDYIFPSVCISHSLKNIHSILFGYLPALLASICILTSFIAIKLHNRDFCLVVWLWKPFRICYARFQRQWGHSGSLVNAFATLWLLCYSRITATSFEIVYPGKVYRVTATQYKGHFLTVAHDPTVRYLSLEHVPYATLASVMLVAVVILPPILLLLYPTRVFRRALVRCGRERWTQLHEFMDTFQGCYVDGTNGTRDCRSMSAFYFILRVLLCFICVFTGNVTASSGIHFYLVEVIVLVVAVTLFAIIRPYKDTTMNTIDILLLSLLIVLGLLFLMVLTQPTTKGESLMAAFFTLYALPQVVFTVWGTYALVRRTRLIPLLHSLLQRVRRRTESNQSRCPNVSASFPHRVVNPGEYEPLLIVNNHSI